MSNLTTVLKYEFYNVLRSKWIIFYTLFLAACTFGFYEVADSFEKIALSLINVLVPIVSLVSILFTATYWYSSERFTEMLLTQPVPRQKLILARLIAIIGALSCSLLVGIYIPFLVHGDISWGSGVIGLASIFLTIVFSVLGVLIGVYISDRMLGIGLGLGLWFYMVVIHDALLLIMLLIFKDYPLDVPSAILGAINPVGLSRVVLLMFFDAPLLLGHTGALIRSLVETGAGYYYLTCFAIVWLLCPTFFAYRKFIYRDF